MKVSFLYIFLIPSIFCFAQKAQFTTVSDELKKGNSYKGSNEEVHFFADRDDIKAFSHNGQLVSVYEEPKRMKFDGRKMDRHSKFIWNGHPFMITVADYKFDKGYFFVLNKLQAGNKVDHDNGVKYAEMRCTDKWGKVVPKFKTLRFVDPETEELFLAHIYWGQTTKEFNAQITVTKFDTDLNPTLIASHEMECSGIKSLYDFSFTKDKLLFIKKPVKENAEYCELTFATNKFSTWDMDFIGLSRHYTEANFVHPTTKESFAIGTGEDENENTVIFIKRFEENGKRVDKSSVFGLTEMPSHDFSFTVTRKLNATSNLVKNYTYDFFNAFSLVNVFTDDENNILMVFDFNLYLSGSRNVTIGDYNKSFEALVISVNPVTLKENWRVVINKSQDPNDLREWISSTSYRDFLGVRTYMYKDKLLITFNDDVKNLRSSVKTPFERLASWTSPRNTIIHSVLIDKNGKAQKVALSRSKGTALMIQDGNPNYQQGALLGSQKHPPLLLAIDKRNMKLGKVE